MQKIILIVTVTLIKKNKQKTFEKGLDFFVMVRPEKFFIVMFKRNLKFNRYMKVTNSYKLL